MLHSKLNIKTGAKAIMLLSEINLTHTNVLSALHETSFDYPWNEKAFFELLTLQTTIGWINENGFLLCSLASDEMEILTICVHPAKRRQGFAKQLLEHLDAYAISHNIQKIHLEVCAQNIAAKELYATYGFKQVGVRKNYYKTTEGMCDALCLTKTFD